MTTPTKRVRINILESRFWDKVLIRNDADCWTWIGRKSVDGYGVFDKRLSHNHFTTITAHRYAYQVAYPAVYVEGLTIDHLCRTRLCCNPAHLEAVTIQENIRRGEVHLVAAKRAAQRTHCPKGHPYDETNTYRRPNRPGRECLICKNAGMRAAYLKRKERQYA